MKIKNLIIIVIISVLAAGCAQAGSIWAKKEQDKKDMYSDDIAREIGDVLTISISEVSAQDNESERTLEKSTSRNANWDGELNIDHVLPSVPGFEINSGTGSESTLEGKADYEDERSYTDFVTVVVIDVMPNGNLVVSGTRNRDIAGDVQKVEVTGIVRPSDISFNNVIDSKKVANFRIKTINEGYNAPYQKPGWLGRIMDILWPF